MIRFEQNGNINLTIETTAAAEEYVSKKKALTNMIIAGLDNADKDTIAECLGLSKAMELDHLQVQKIIDSENNSNIS